MTRKETWQRLVELNAVKKGKMPENFHLREANLREANLTGANFLVANLVEANLRGAYLRGAYLKGANLSGANLVEANLSGANLVGANLVGAYLRGANLRGADLTGAKGLVKIMGAIPGNRYWKRFDPGLNNNGYQFRVGINTLKEGEIFASDERILCSYPGFHFSSRSWCAIYYPNRSLEAIIRIPEDAQINEPWATDGKCSADKIEILEVYDVKTGKNVTERYAKQ